MMSCVKFLSEFLFFVRLAYRTVNRFSGDRASALGGESVQGADLWEGKPAMDSQVQ